MDLLSVVKVVPFLECHINTTKVFVTDFCLFLRSIHLIACLLWAPPPLFINQLSSLFPLHPCALCTQQLCLGSSLPGSFSFFWSQMPPPPSIPHHASPLLLLTHTHTHTHIIIFLSDSPIKFLHVTIILFSYDWFFFFYFLTL